MGIGYLEKVSAMFRVNDPSANSKPAAKSKLSAKFKPAAMYGTAKSNDHKKVKKELKVRIAAEKKLLTKIKANFLLASQFNRHTLILNASLLQVYALDVHHSSGLPFL